MAHEERGRLVWSDEFRGPPGAPPDPSVWTHETGAGGWGDEQLQRYTAATSNACLTASGHLALTARREADGEITSARLVTKDTVTVEHGRVEARIRLPQGAGLWPAFWMLGADIDTVGWPACGEIDVMEHVGSEPSAVHGTVHGPGYSGIGGGVGGVCRGGRPLGSAFHVFGVTWSPDEIRWHVDGADYFRCGPDDVTGPWPFRHPFYLLLNLAVGGRWPGNRADGLRLPATMLVDWVRVHD